MRPLLITALVLGAAALGCGAPAWAAPAPQDHPAARAGVTPNRASTGQPPFGGTFESRLERLGADVDDGLRHGWWGRDQARDFTRKIKALADRAEAARSRNGGKLAQSDTRVLQNSVTRLHREMADMARAATSRG